MRPLRVLVMMDEGLIPPEDVGGMDERAIAPFKTEHDVLEGLNALGHDARPVGVKTDLAPLHDALQEFRPHICFNLCEDFDGIATRDHNVVSFLELVHRPYTGCNPRGLVLARDKALTKKVLAYHGLNVPRFEVFPLGRAVRRPDDLAYPLVVKSLIEEGSTGISQASVVRDDAQLAERVAFIHERLGTDAIAEQYVHGRELYVGVMGNRRLKVLPIWEMSFGSLPDDALPIATQQAKWNPQYQKRCGIESHPARDLPPSTRRAIEQVCRTTYRALELSGYARVDLRLTATGEIYVLEANPNPQIARGHEFADSAAEAGLNYGSLLQSIVRMGLNYRPAGVLAA